MPDPTTLLMLPGNVRRKLVAESGRIVWVVGQIREWPAWELQGIYDLEPDAVAQCLDEKWFVGTIAMNSPLPRETVPWLGCRYPKAIPIE